MCGIAGVYHWGTGSLVSVERLQRMTRVLTHRGPDDEGYYIEPGVGLGHRRLNIIDLATGHQPMVSQDGSKVIVFNGEIYNFKELRDLFTSKGYSFQTHSDTEVILAAYGQNGEEGIKHLRGMFAFAIWDKRERKLFLARDRVGKKPLYFSVGRKTFTFGSEIKALLQDPEISREIDYEALSDYLSFSYIAAPKTIFKGIRKLLPGHTLTVTRNGVVIKQYWDLEFSPELGELTRETTEQFLKLLGDSVGLRLVSDVPLGAFLSGGLDSSAVVALMSQKAKSPIKTFSIGFEEKEFNELPYARTVARLFRTDHHEHVLKADMADIVDTLVSAFDEPFGDSSAIPTYYLSQAARRHVTVALAGDGGDENLAGYRRHLVDVFVNRLRLTIPTNLLQLLTNFPSRLSTTAQRLPHCRRVGTFIKKLSLTPEGSYYYTMTSFKDEEKRHLLRPDIQDELKGYCSFSVLERYFDRASGLDPLSRMLYVDIKTYLPDDILTKVDRTSMANSLEVRSPFLDNVLMEFMASLPSQAKLRGRQSKAILREAMTGILELPILTREKQGFAIPLGMWLGRSWKNLGAQCLLDPSSGLYNYVNRKFVQEIWQEHQSGIRDWETELWNLIMLEAWHRRYLRAMP